jgi:hypothetical protein
MPILYLDRHIAYWVGGKMQVTLRWPNTPYGPITKVEMFDQPSPWHSDEDVLVVVQSAFPDYAVQFLGVEAA